MGLCNSPDIFQEHMSELMWDLEYVRAYIDDLVEFTKGSFEDHLEKVEQVLTRVQDAGLKVHVKKSFFAKHVRCRIESPCKEVLLYQARIGISWLLGHQRMCSTLAQESRSNLEYFSS